MPKKSKFTKQYAKLLEVLREVRLEAALTQTEAGQSFGAHASYISKCESGERRIDVIELAAFCKLYKIPLDQFLKRAGLL